MANDADATGKIAELRDLSGYLYDLAIMVPEHCEMLFRLSDKLLQEAERLQRESLPPAMSEQRA